jgi:hypothetical protein
MKVKLRIVLKGSRKNADRAVFGSRKAEIGERNKFEDTPASSLGLDPKGTA